MLRTSTIHSAPCESDLRNARQRLLDSAGGAMVQIVRYVLFPLLVLIAGCEDPVDPGQVAREDRPPEADPPLVMETQKPPPASPRLRETRSLGYAGDQPLSQVPPRPSMFEQERATQPRIAGQRYYYYGGYPYGGGRPPATQPAQPIGTSNLIWSKPSAPTGVPGQGGMGGATGYGSPAGSPLGPR